MILVYYKYNFKLKNMESKISNAEKFLMLYFKAKEKEFQSQFRSELEEFKKEILALLGNHNEYLTKNEVCKIYKFSPTSFERYVKDGLPVFSTGAGCNRKILKQDIEDYIKSRGKLNKKLYGKNR